MQCAACVHLWNKSLESQLKNKQVCSKLVNREHLHPRKLQLLQYTAPKQIENKLKTKPQTMKMVKEWGHCHQSLSSVSNL